jgi:Zn-dependent peptidase ImmA (M78 family)
MSGDSYLVLPRSWRQVDEVATTFQQQLGLSDVPLFPVMDVLEIALDLRLNIVRLEICSHLEMGAAEGLTCPRGEFIRLREDVYEAACRGEGRARFTVAHELGHLLLHANAPLARASGTERPFSLSEPQANRFAATLLMPAKFISPTDNQRSVATRHGVSLEAAAHRLRDLQKK